MFQSCDGIDDGLSIEVGEGKDGAGAPSTLGSHTLRSVFGTKVPGGPSFAVEYPETELVLTHEFELNKNGGHQAEAKSRRGSQSREEKERISENRS